MLDRRLIFGMVLFVSAGLSGEVGEPAPFEDPAEFPLMGDWEGSWIDAQRGHEAHHPRLCAQILPMDEGTWRVAFLPELYVRSEPYLDVVVPGSPSRIEVNEGGFEVVFENGKAIGEALLHGLPTKFELKKTVQLSPTLGLEPPEGAVVLFDGSSLEHWRHLEDRPVSWPIVDGALEVNSSFWNGGENGKNGIGGMLVSRQSFRSLRMHLEFRYPVERGKRGQERGNSGLFLHPVGEIQILNSYMTAGYWDECGAVYRAHPAKVNAAGSPLQWQTYDVVLCFSEDHPGHCELMVRLNGHIVHNRLLLEANASEVTIMLQDHINRVQFRNIWVQPY